VDARLDGTAVFAIAGAVLLGVTTMRFFALKEGEALQFASASSSSLTV
jgi:hypothetical protein